LSTRERRVIVTQSAADQAQQRRLIHLRLADAVFKDITFHLEHPFYTLSKRPDTTIWRYEHNGEDVEFVLSVEGLATIYDKISA
jgi:hypothetical protein